MEESDRLQRDVPGELVVENMLSPEVTNKLHGRESHADH
jgi:hypothetical protein